MVSTGSINKVGAGAVVVGAGGWGLEILNALQLFRQWFCTESAEGVVCPVWAQRLMAWPVWITPALLLIGFACFWIARRRERPPGPVANFYATRLILNEARGGIWREVQRHQEVWAVWPSGTTIVSNEDENSLRKLRRVILTNPDASNPLFPTYCARIGAGQGWTRNTIRRATRLAQRAGCDVRWLNDVTISAAIFDPKDGVAVRFEWLLPAPREAGDRPSVLVFGNQYPGVVSAVKAMFEDMWQRSIEAPDLKASDE